MAEAIVLQERLLYASYSPPHLYEDGQPVVTTLLREPTDGGEMGYTIREYSLAKGICSTVFPEAAATGAGR